MDRELTDEQRKGIEAYEKRRLEIIREVERRFEEKVRQRLEKAAKGRKKS